ncbi:MAG: DUF5069 domain-containing protein [Terracidiphilus sp.]
MSTPITVRDLSKQAPHSPRERAGGFVIASRAVDKCRAVLAGTPGEYHYDCPLDNMLYEDVGAWLQASGTAKTPAEIKTWSDEMEAGSPMKNPERRAHFIENCSKLGLNPETTTTFDWLEADDRASFSSKSVCR